MRYLVLLSPSEDREFGRDWHICKDAHSPEAAVEDACRNVAVRGGEKTLVFEVPDGPTLVETKVEFAIITANGTPA